MTELPPNNAVRMGRAGKPLVKNYPQDRAEPGSNLTRNKIVELHSTGMPAMQIADTLGVTVSYVNKTLVRLGVRRKINPLDGRLTHPLHRTWTMMKQRCCSPNHISYHNYGGRGISVCDRWLNDFWAFVEDVGEKPTPRHQLDRIDNDGNYEPGNVRWATPSQQRRNTRFTRLTDGQVARIRTLFVWPRKYCDGINTAELAKEFGVSKDTIRQVVRYEAWL